MQILLIGYVLLPKTTERWRVWDASPVQHRSFWHQTCYKGFRMGRLLKESPLICARIEKELLRCETSLALAKERARWNRAILAETEAFMNPTELLQEAPVASDDQTISRNACCPVALAGARFILFSSAADRLDAISVNLRLPSSGEIASGEEALRGSQCWPCSAALQTSIGSGSTHLRPI